MNYRVNLTLIPSNLGTGSNYYFECPKSGKRAKILYLCRDSHYFVHRKEYSDRIYYSYQISSNINFLQTRILLLENLDEKVSNKIKKEHYKGKKTLSLKKKEAIAKKIEICQDLRDKNLENDYRKTLLREQLLSNKKEMIINKFKQKHKEY